MDVFTVEVGEKILFLGEGNFSFCVDFIKLNKDVFVKDLQGTSSTEIIATCFELNDNLSESKRCNISFLEKMGVTVLFNIDATRLKDYSFLGHKRFTKIIFNFPHVGGKMKIHLNRKLLAELFVSSRDILDESGQILLTLCDGQGGTDADTIKRRWDDTWKVVEMAAGAGFALKNVHPFSLKRFPGYVNTGFRSLEKGFNADCALTHVFKVGRRFINLKEDEIESILCCDKISTSVGLEDVCKVHSKKILHHPLKNKSSPQAYLYDIIKRSKFLKDIRFYEDSDLIYGFSCLHKNLCDLVKKLLASSPNYVNTIGVYKVLALNELTDNFSQPPVCCNIVCVGNESCTFTKQVISELLTSFAYSDNVVLSSTDSETNELLYVNGQNRFDILKINKFHSNNDNNLLDVCTVYLDNLARFLFNLNNWHELWAEGTTVGICEGRAKLYTPCLFPCTYTFDLSLSAQENFSEKNFYNILWHVAGNIIFNVSLISTYRPPNNNKNFCYRISYRSYEVPLCRRQIIDIQRSVIGRTLERLLNVTVL